MHVFFLRKAGLFVLYTFLSFCCVFSHVCFELSMGPISTSDCLERLVSEMTYNNHSDIHKRDVKLPLTYPAWHSRDVHGLGPSDGLGWVKKFGPMYSSELFKMPL